MTSVEKQYDLVSLGEPLLRLSPPGFGQLRRATSLNACVVSSQLNVAADLARLGRKTVFLTKLPDNPLGLLALDACRSYGVDVSHIKIVPEGRMGVTYVEFSAAPRVPVAVYDRAGSAASTIGPADFDWEKILERSTFAYTDGIFPGLSASCMDAAIAYLSTAKQVGCTVCFDVNYREHLWRPESAREAWLRLLPYVDILVTNRAVSQLVLGYDGSDEDILRSYIDNFGCRVACLTKRQVSETSQGAWESFALTAEGVSATGNCYTYDVVDRYGTGDAWFAGFIYAYACHERGLEYALSFGNAMCALAHTVDTDIAHLTVDQIESLINHPEQRDVRR